MLPSLFDCFVHLFPFLLIVFLDYFVHCFDSHSFSFITPHLYLWTIIGPIFLVIDIAFQFKNHVQERSILSRASERVGEPEDEDGDYHPRSRGAFLTNGGAPGELEDLYSEFEFGDRGRADKEGESPVALKNWKKKNQKTKKQTEGAPLLPGNLASAGQADPSGVIALNYYPKASKRTYTHPVYSIVEQGGKGNEHEKDKNKGSWFQIGWSKKYTQSHELVSDFPHLELGGRLHAFESSTGNRVSFVVADLVSRPSNGRSQRGFASLATFRALLVPVLSTAESAVSVTGVGDDRDDRGD